jgi:hypothetical protein
LERITPRNRHFFFGYYDKTPWNLKENKILCCETGAYGREPKVNDLLILGFIDLANKTFHRIAHTVAWNFQQGCMLQWVDDDTVLYNQRLKNKHVSYIANLQGKTLAEIQYPIYAVSHRKKLAMSVDFSRIHTYRPGYGYLGGRFINDDLDGIRAIDLLTQQSQLIVTYRDIKSKIHHRLSNEYWVDHILFSPSDEYITFLFRSITQDQGVFSRLFCCRNDGSDLRCLLDTGMASHADWYDNNTFAIWGRKYALTSAIRKMKLPKFAKAAVKLIRRIGVPDGVRKSIYGDAFLMIDVRSGEITTFAKNIPVRDGGGHFTFMKNGEWMLTDTDINAHGIRKLMLYDMKGENVTNVANVYTPVEIHETPYRCDLHPRCSPSEQMICIDSVHEGYRGMYILNASIG